MTDVLLYDAVPWLLVLTRLALIVLSVFFIWSNLDELLIDCIYIFRGLYRRLFIYPRFGHLHEEKLLEVPEKSVAIMIPCWDESQVIGKMLENTLATINYANYHIFVGTYPNDPATQAVVDETARLHPNVVKVVCQNDGPTNKADCLNWVYSGIKRFENERGAPFDILVMNDSEDIVHPLYLKLMNYLIPRKDMVQLPVFPMEPPAWHFTGGHYVDEFAENHSKDLTVRETMAGVIPCAGTGAGYSRALMERVAADNAGQLFNVRSMTEDYDFGLRLARYNVQQIFVRYAVKRTKPVKTWFGGVQERDVDEWVVIREYFPDTFRAAVKQKSRWIMGIALQGWASIGWTGGLAGSYWLYRDRKALLANQVTMLGNLLVPLVLLIWLYQSLDPFEWRYPPLIEKGSTEAVLLYINLGFLVWRAAWRCYYVQKLYDAKQAALSLLRLPWANFINFMATWRALSLFTRYLVTGKQLAWEKTAHVYPTTEQLAAYRARLGDMLVARRLIDARLLDEALAEQKRSGLPLGEVLLERGLLSEGELASVLGTQLRLSVTRFDAATVPLTALSALPETLALRYGLFPLELAPDNSLSVACEHLPSQVDLKRLEELTGHHLHLVLTTKGDLASALAHGYERLSTATRAGEKPLGQRLIERGAATSAQVADALARQREGYRLVGDILLADGAITRQSLDEASAAYFSGDIHAKRFGEFLVEAGYVSREDLNRSLARQRARHRFVGDILGEMGVSPEVIREELSRKDDPAAGAAAAEAAGMAADADATRFTHKRS